MITILNTAKDLPEEWDPLADHYFQTREFLIHTENYNPCSQRYYLYKEENTLNAGAVLYTLKMDLLTFLKIASPVKMHITGIPCSVSSSGFVGDKNYHKALAVAIKSKERGLNLLLNLDNPLELDKTADGSTLPTMILKNTFSTWEDYLSSLKSHYRRKLQISEKALEGVSRRQSSCNKFTNQMYALYLEVLERSQGKLETLSCSFFKNLPSGFTLNAFYHKEQLIGWYITTSYKKHFYFFLGGLDYSLNSKFHTYFNILTGVLKDGITAGASYIDLGQTAESPKTRLGGRLIPKQMIGFHTNGILNSLLLLFKGALEYKCKIPQFTVFKEVL